MDWTRLARWDLSGWRGYALALVLVVIGGLARIAITPLVGYSVPYALFVPALIVVPLGGGFRVGLFTAIASVAFGWVFILDGLSLTEKVVSTLVLLGPILVIVAGMAWLRQGLVMAQSAREEAEAARAQAEAALDRSELLTHELNHRVKNLFSVIGSIVSLSGRSTPEAKEVLERIRQRINALAVAHTISQGQLETEAVPLGRIVEATLAAHDHGGIAIEGPEVPLPFEAVTPMGLILHELTTNAVKHGSLSVPGGRVSVRWTLSDGGTVRFEWRETDGPPIAGEPASGGFGAVMLRQAEAQLGATVRREWPPEGFRMVFEFPLQRSNRQSWPSDGRAAPGSERAATVAAA